MGLCSLVGTEELAFFLDLYQIPLARNKEKTLDFLVLLKLLGSPLYLQRYKQNYPTASKGLNKKDQSKDLVSNRPKNPHQLNPPRQ